MNCNVTKQGNDFEVSRDRQKATEILMDNMTDKTAAHIHEICFLPDFIVDAMIEYHNYKRVKNQL